MLRDIPWIYVGMYLGVVFIVSTSIWFTNQYARGADTLELNEALQISATTEYDPSTRVYDNVYVLGQTFESSVWDKISDRFPEQSRVQFDYIFDVNELYTVGIYDEEGYLEGASSPEYIIGGSPDETPSIESSGHLFNGTQGYPVQYIRVKVALPNDKVDEWTYISTVVVDVIKDEVTPM